MNDGKDKQFPRHYILEILAVVVVVAMLAAMAKPVILKSARKSAITEATSNAKQIHYLLVEFDQDYGCFPNDATAIDELAGYSGDFSNDYLAQIIAGGYTKSEEIFYAKGGAKRNKKPDNVTSDREHILEAGECGFAYIKGLNSKSHPKTPILLTPVLFDGTKFDSDPHAGKAVVLRIDGSVRQRVIDQESGEIKLDDGKTLFQAGEKTVWGVKGFDLKNLMYPK